MSDLALFAPDRTGASLIHADALHIPLADESVDLIVTSPPYFALRSYQDGGEHYDGQIGSEAHPQLFLEALWAVMTEGWRVLKPGGSCWVNLGDKRAGSGGHNNANLMPPRKMDRPPHTPGGSPRPANPDEPRNRYLADMQATRRSAPDRYQQAHFGRRKVKQMLPHRFAIGCEDGLADPAGIGWIVRQDQVWSKTNGLPESVTDRTRDAHEYWFHLTKTERYYAAVDEVRETYSDRVLARQQYVGSDAPARTYGGHSADGARGILGLGSEGTNPLGKLPGSVWSIPSEPLAVPAHLGIDHFAAFPQEWPRRLILGWSPSGVCVACGEGRRPTVKATRVKSPVHSGGSITGNRNGGPDERGWDGLPRFNVERAITGHACACPDTSAPTRPAVVLDPFGGTGTVAGVARALGRYGVNLDLSRDYLRLADWRIFESGHFAKSIRRTKDEQREAELEALGGQQELLPGGAP